MAAWLHQVIQPVHIVGYACEKSSFTQQFANHKLISFRETDDFPLVPWEWFPHGIESYGIGLDGAVPRLWFIGEPRGQEETSWRDLVLAVGRGQKILTPMTEALIDGISRVIKVAVLTTPS